MLVTAPTGTHGSWHHAHWMLMPVTPDWVLAPTPTKAGADNWQVFFQAIAVPVVPFVRLRVKPSRSQLDKMSSAAVASSLTARSYGYIDTINPLTCPEVRRAAWAKRWEPEVVDQKVGDDAYSVARWLMKV